ncbi:hypothetical protein ElyMa_001534000 [Elysia marginata]|uniref:Apple domain-containing protein n=1 Tax=Elysia marginata TaxID=1093978 RepID=A0AAV4JA98_9GAST|nr:hypothetical protein ElyMa_001534000 [Elysia marginata]
MKLTVYFITFASFSLSCLIYTHGKILNFRYISRLRYPKAQEQKCKDLGYDGLAVLNTPEAFNYAIKIANIAHGVYIGIQYKPELGQALWDDGTTFGSDLPFHSPPPFTDPDKSFGRIIWSKKIAVGEAAQARPALCSKYNQTSSESTGSTLSGELQTTSRTVLFVSRILSFQECAVLCGMTSDCRAAEFNSNLFTCTVIGQYTSTGQSANPYVFTYMRQTF